MEEFGLCGEGGGGLWGLGGLGGRRAPVDIEGEPVLPTAWPLGIEESSAMSLEGEESRLDLRHTNTHTAKSRSMQNTIVLKWYTVFKEGRTCPS